MGAISISKPKKARGSTRQSPEEPSRARLIATQVPNEDGPMAAKKLVSIKIVREHDASFVVRTFADGETVRERLLKKKATRRPFRPQRKMKMDHTRKKQF